MENRIMCINRSLNQSCPDGNCWSLQLVAKTSWYDNVSAESNRDAKACELIHYRHHEMAAMVEDMIYLLYFLEKRFGSLVRSANNRS